MAIFILSFFVFVPPSTVKALELTDIYQAAPPGISLNDYMEYQPIFPTTEKVNNSVQVLKASSTGYPSDIIQLTNGEKQVSSIWGTVSNPDQPSSVYDYNYFDLTKKQVISGWLHLGEDFNSSADGLALVLQNDDRGINAISNYQWTTGFLIPQNHSKAYGGESLGVWGTSGGGNAKATNITDFAATAIQNSLALEFDSFRNETPSVVGGSTVDNYFDAALSDKNSLEAKGKHVAWNYPGEPSTYIYNMNLVYMYYAMHHNDAIHDLVLAGYDGNPELDEAWHHFTFTYDPPTTTGGTDAHISYIFNDKEYDGTVKPYRKWDKRENILIDTSKFGLKSGQTKIRWGFTGSTGSPNSTVGDNSIVLETIPRVANVTPTTSLYDLTQKRDIPDLDRDKDANSNVNNGDQLRFDYLLNYTDGLTETGDITTTIELPKNVDFTKNSDDNLGKITYTTKDGKTTTVDIPKSDLSSDGTSIDLELTSMDENNPNILIQLYGTAQAPESDEPSSTTVDGAHTSYRSDFYKGDAMSPAFKINNEELQIHSSTDLTQTIKYGTSIQIQGNAQYVKGTPFDGSDLTMHTTVDGEELATAEVSTINNNTYANFTAAYNELEIGEHKIEVYLTDSGRRISNTLTYDITVNDLKNLKLTSTETALNGFTDSTFDLSGYVSYDDDSSFTGSDIDMYYVIDGGRELHETMTGTDKVTSYKILHSIEAGTLDVGTHNIVVYAKDGNRTSNSLIFTVDVADKSLVLTPDDAEITVKDNNSVKISGTYKYSDGTEVSAKTLKYSYQITNEGETPQDTVSKTFDNSGSVSLTLDPIAKGKPVTKSLEEYLETHKTGLKEGKNKITVTVDDQVGHVSNAAVFIINVPEENPKISTTQNDLEVTTLNPVKLLAKFNYADDDYVLGKTDAHAVFTSIDSSGNKATDRTMTQLSTASVTPVNMDAMFDGSDVGMETAGGPYKLELYYTDPYGRKTNTITYNITILQNYLKLDVSENLKFKTIKYGQELGEDNLVHRDGEWKVNVNSFKSKWTLNAKGGVFTNTDDPDKTMSAQMMFLNSSGAPQILDGNPTIARQETSSSKEATTDISSGWEDDEGILLRVDSIDQAGTYNSEIQWSLTDSF